MKRILLVAGLLAGATSIAAAQPAARVDSVFARFARADAPGCVVGVSRNGRDVLTRAYGAANLEFAAPLTANSILEAGSVSKQFTAAAIALLAAEGKLSIDDPVRRHVPDLPAVMEPIRLRHMLSHTSGLRDWGSLAALAGWPRGLRAHTHAHVLDILSRQQALNFPPGTEYSYSDSGYNLLAIIVERVSGQTLDQYTQEKIFKPFGMTRTQWRDDVTEIVPGRAVAYSPNRGSYRLDMPYEFVYGNGGLLTAVGDLLRWSENFRPGSSTFGRVGGKALVDALETRAVLASGDTITYARGLVVDARTAASAASAASGGLEAVAGLYRDTIGGDVLRLSLREGRLRLGFGAGSPALIPAASNRFRLGASNELRWMPPSGSEPARVVLTGVRGRPVTYVAVAPTSPAPGALAAYAGDYATPELGVTYRVGVDGERLTAQLPPGAPMPLERLDADGFRAGARFVRFARDASGRVNGFELTTDRVHRLRFERAGS